jgi:hypothetical protein
MENLIVNLTQHSASVEQIDSGVVEPLNKKEVQDLLTFSTLPSVEEVSARATALADLVVAEGYKKAMLGGAPFLMGPLELALKLKGIEPLYAFSTRESRDEVLPDGSIKKVAIFRHSGWVRSTYEIEEVIK